MHPDRSSKPCSRRSPGSFQIQRRTFLKQCTAAAAAAGVPLWFAGCALPADSTRRKRPAPNDRP
ncbi:MAG: twin-arginine translocation signal domain-containing protein, partial [Opitutus sp.]